LSGGEDWLADPTDVAALTKNLPIKPVFTFVEPTYAHVDFIWAPSAYKLLYPSILQLLQKYSVNI